MNLDAIAIYVKVVQAGSFSKAARLLGMPNTTVSAKVARLEKDLGVTLIRRTTRRLHVTPVGKAYFKRCQRGIAELETAEAELRSAKSEPCGNLRITVPGDVAHSLLPPIAVQYLQTYARVGIEVIVANRVIDLIGENIDLAIRAGPLKDSTLISRKFLSIKGGFWASRACLASHGEPRSLDDLKTHPCLVFSRMAGQVIRLHDGDKTAEVSLTGRLAADDLEALMACIVQDGGIGVLPEFLARAPAARGELVRVLPRWTWTAGALSFVYPKQPFVPANVRAFIDLAVASLKEAQS